MRNFEWKRSFHDFQSVIWLSSYRNISEASKILGFEWTLEDESTKYFQFCVLLFGLLSACYVFTKVLRTFIKRWRSIGIKAIIKL